jgi:plastocyanin
MTNILLRTCVVGAAIVIAGWAGAASPGGAPASVSLTLKNHHFTPAILTIPAGTRVRVTLVNRDPATEEFDSHDLRIEQLVTPMGQASFNLGPLRPGEYSFMGEFHAETAQGKVVVVPAGR